MSRSNAALVAPGRAAAAGVRPARDVRAGRPARDPLAQLGQGDFNRLRQLLEDSFGLKMPPHKKLLLESRLSKRLHALGQPSMAAYCDFLCSEAGMESELVHMVDVVTTNKTEFFREPHAFEFLAAKGLPDLLAGGGALVLSEKQIDLCARQLEQRCRNVAY